LHNARSTDEALLRRLIAEDCPVLRATALVLLTRAGLATEVDQAELKALLHAPDDAPKIAIARAIAHNPIADFEDYLIELSTDRSIAVQNAVLAAMSASPTARYLPTLMRLLPRRELRQAARATLLSMGETALSFLAGALVDETRPAAQRRHLPRTIMRFGGQRAADLLLEQLPVEPDGVVRYKILRALTQMHNGDSAIHLSHAVLDGATDETARHVYQLIAWRFVLEQRRASQLQDSTQAHALLVRLLRDKQIHALDRLFLLLGLRFPKEDVAAIHRALQSRDAKVRSSGRELLENLLPPPKRTAILGLTDDVPDRERLLRAGAFAPNQPSDYEGVLQALLDTSSAVIRSLAVYHAAELGLSSLRPRIELLTRPEDGLLASVAQMAIDWFADLQRREAPARG
jgi:hypothetical protein